MLVFLASCLSISSASSQFGHPLLSRFALNPNYTNLNHGSYGSVPNDVMTYAHEVQREVELNPDAFFRYDVWPRFQTIRQKMASFIGSEAEDTVFIDNASGGVNAVLRSLDFSSGSGPHKILYLITAYGMVKNCLGYLHSRNGVDLIEVPVLFPFDSKQLVASVTNTLAQHKGEVLLAIFSHITSIPAVILPISELSAACHAQGVQVLVDGAHALGQIPVNVQTLGADYYLTNGHKWFYTPKGSALLWVKKQYQDNIFPPVISGEGQGSSQFQMQFSYSGTADYSAWFAFEAALSFRASVGSESEIMSYMHNLAVQGGNLLANKWKTEIMFTPDLYGSLVTVRVPCLNATMMQGLDKKVLDTYNIWVPFFTLPTASQVREWKYTKGSPLARSSLTPSPAYYTRVSAQIYNELSDFEILGEAVLSLLKNC